MCSKVNNFKKFAFFSETPEGALEAEALKTSLEWAPVLCWASLAALSGGEFACRFEIHQSRNKVTVL